jgi:hypothetical protein
MMHKKGLKNNSIIKFKKKIFLILFFLFLNRCIVQLFAVNSEPDDLNNIITVKELGFISCADPKRPTREEILNVLQNKNTIQISENEIDINFDATWPYKKSTIIPRMHTSSIVTPKYKGQADLTYTTDYHQPVDLSTIIKIGNLGNFSCSNPNQPTEDEILNQLIKIYNTLKKEELEIVLDQTNPNTQAVVQAKKTSTTYVNTSYVKLNFKTFSNVPNTSDSSSNWFNQLGLWSSTFVIAASGTTAYYATVKVKKKKKNKKTTK